MAHKALDNLLRTIHPKYSNYGTNYAITQVLNNMSKKEFRTLYMYFLMKEKAKVDEYITSGMDITQLPFGIRNRYVSSLKYNSLLHNFFNSSSSMRYKTRIPGIMYLTGRYYIAHFDEMNLQETPLVCAVIKREHIPYFKAAQLLDDPVSTSLIELWVKEGFDHKDTIHRGLRPKYRKFIKKPLALKGVEIVEKKDFSELVMKYNPPKVANVQEYERFLEDACKESLEALNSKIEKIIYY
jgi:hypothetical protein